MATNKGGRPATGCPKWNPTKSYWEARVGPTRKIVPMRGIAETETGRAKHMARIIALRFTKTGAVPEESAETVNEWSDRWIAEREKRGNATVGHDCTLEDYVTINPLVAISGGVHIGRESMMGTHSAVLQNLSIGAGSTVGAGSCVVKDVLDDVIVKGVPAR